MKVINKLESYPTGDMIVPYCPNCDNPTYSERKCPFCNTELEYEKIIEKDKEIERLNNIINELEKEIDNFDVFKKFTFPLMKRWEEEQVKSSIDYEWRKAIKKPFLDKIKELKGVDKE